MADEETPSPYSFLTISVDAEGDVVVDLGSLTHWEAWGLLLAATQEVASASPEIALRSNGEPFFVWAEDEEDPEDG